MEPERLRQRQRHRQTDQRTEGQEERGSALQGMRSLGKKGGTPGAVIPLPGAPGERCLDAWASPGPSTSEPKGPRDSGTRGQDQ